MTPLGQADGTLPDEVLDTVREQLARTGATLSPEVVAHALRTQGRPVGDATVLEVHDLLRRDVLGAGPLEPLLRLPGVTDVLVNGLWGYDPPLSAVNMVQGYISRLRKTVRPEASDGAATAVLQRRRPGYLLELAAQGIRLPSG